MEFSNIFLVSFYVLLGVLAVVIGVPALYSLMPKKRTAPMQVHHTHSIPANMTIVNSESNNTSQLAALTSSGTIEQIKRKSDYTSNVKTQEMRTSHRQSKFEVFNQTSISNHSVPSSNKNWSSHWN